MTMLMLRDHLSLVLAAMLLATRTQKRKSISTGDAFL